VACGDDSSNVVPFDSIPPDKKLIDLNSAEQQGTCQWATQLADEKLRPGGVALTCNGTPLNISSCSFPTSAQTACTATVGEWKVCFPNFLDRIAQDPCQVLSLAFSQSELETFVNETPGCAGLGPCAYTIQ
jgi:hypothetical protein